MIALIVFFSIAAALCFLAAYNIKHPDLLMPVLHRDSYKIYEQIRKDLPKFRCVVKSDQAYSFRYGNKNVMCWHRNKRASIHIEPSSKCLFSSYFDKRSAKLYDLLMVRELVDPTPDALCIQ